ncbi:SNF2 family N-terminal domain-domain-containing protein [Protomyces lactucae-debilis]|uniref:Chromatin-remodeling ATPase INO80 n=1 Tax=Protomyces lactucae-debilis TaxID=2754530 RepID=A0A1Y2FWD3_PROLT|nr:SNF2 family N-terminal domain-containing protein [Protomyces lactucae-debilis]ORY87847.1 SNF2 family N-terminal domain-domain-containing protein [Protomyces lactucae-debilis]
MQRQFEEQHVKEAHERAAAELEHRKIENRKEAARVKRRARTAAQYAAAQAQALKEGRILPPKRGIKRRPDDNASFAGSVYDDDADSVLDDGPGVGPIVPPKRNLDALHDQVWKDLAKKEVPKVYRLMLQHQNHRNANHKKTIQLCAKEARRWQFRTNKNVKDMQNKCKRATREMMYFWKRNERGDKLERQRAEREIIDKAKKEEDEREARRQARKLNFLLTQTELYSHFIGNKVKTAEAEQSEDTQADARLSAPKVAEPAPLQPGEEAPTAVDFDADDDAALQQAAARNAQQAVQRAKEKAQGFDTDSGARANLPDADAMDLDFQNPTTLGESIIAQPKMLNATLKEYQLKGLNWLVNLYEQGINGILADEMGLGKTVQSISVMAHLAETYNIWGPFLVIAPASTLHNWQQEISKFVPRLKALPYWGSTKDRKVLRKFWDRKRATYTEDAPFHVVVTSYQLVVQDAQYFQNVKWQYMILDEAQAIKSSQSSRWKNLLAFKCRNRLLLTGTPIQNTMQELWALLHFIMPGLFDSHNEFSEWFSKDIESHAQKNSELNADQLQRLHMILKPFMLRRVKKHVQKELGDKIELEVFCDLNMRQRQLYQALRKEISTKDILDKATSDSDSALSSLMNLVMQLRKVCNHPDLFERTDVKAPLALVNVPKTGSFAKETKEIELKYASTAALSYTLPKLVYRAGGLLDVPNEHSKAGFNQKYLGNLLNLFNPAEAKSSRLARLAGLSASEVWQMRQHPLQAQLTVCPNGRLQTSSQTRPFSTDSALARLMNISKAYSRSRNLHRVDPMYDPKVTAPAAEIACSDYTFCRQREQASFDLPTRRLLNGLSLPEENAVVDKKLLVTPVPPLYPHTDQEKRGYSGIRMPSMQTFITDSGKLAKLDALLSELKAGDHRVLIYFQMTKMIDLMEEYLVYRQYKYLRLDGSSKIADRRDMVTDWQTRPEIFVFLLSTRAGGLGINLTAADTIVLYDSDWNPTVDAQAIDRAHRLGQTRQVTVYRLITSGTIEERILERAKQKEAVQQVVIAGGDYKAGTTDSAGGADGASAAPKKIEFQSAKGSGGRDVVSWLLEDGDADRLLDERDATSGGNQNGRSRMAAPAALEALYHEGEGNFSGLHTPDEALSAPTSPRLAPASANKKKRKAGEGGSAKRVRIQEL